MELLTSIWPIVNILILIIGGGVYIYSSYRKSNQISDDETISKYKEAVNIRDIEINDLKKKIEEIQKSHIEAMTSMQNQVNLLQAQINSLSNEKKTLQDTVTGAKTLEQIMKMLVKFDELLGKGGLLERFAENDISMMGDLRDIKNALDIKKRNGD